MEIKLRQTPVRPILVDALCADCDGWYVPDGQLELIGRDIPHKCVKCGHNIYFEERFPALRYVKEGETLDLDNFVSPADNNISTVRR